MERRKWESKEKVQIVLEGLKGRPVVEICNSHQISQAQYYQWREQFLSNASKARGESTNRERISSAKGKYQAKGPGR